MNHEDKGAISIAGIGGSRARAATECAALETGVLAVGDASEGGVDESLAAGSTATGNTPRLRGMSGASPTSLSAAGPHPHGVSLRDSPAARAALGLRTPWQRGAPSSGRITTLESLREHLQWAIELEHSTLPPYLCALYSLDPDRNPEATEVMVSVLVEEMLHMTLVANLMNAVGGRPRLDTPEMLAPYPRWLPHGDRSFEVPLVRFGLEALEVFLKIEQPAPPCAPPESDGYETIGQFYQAIERGLRELCAQIGESNFFCGDPARQVTDAFYSCGGRIITIENLATALAALEEIVEQGEGADHLQVWDRDCDLFHPEREQVAHYYRFQQLKLGRRYRRGDTPRSGPTGDPIIVDWGGVRPMRSNPRTADHAPGSPIRRAQEEFNRTYCTILHLLERAFDGSPQILGTAIGAMYGLKAQAQTLMQLPTEDGHATAGPTFEYFPPNRRASERSMLGGRLSGADS